MKIFKVNPTTQKFKNLINRKLKKSSLRKGMLCLAASGSTMIFGSCTREIPETIVPKEQNLNIFIQDTMKSYSYEFEVPIQ